MIKTAEEFIRLRQSENLEEQSRASREPAEIEIWLEIIDKYPEFKVWIAHNKTIQIEILEILSNDIDPTIRESIARKRKINETIFSRLSQDTDENVRYALIWNTKISVDKIKMIKVDDSEWLKIKLTERLENIVKEQCSKEENAQNYYLSGINELEKGDFNLTLVYFEKSLSIEPHFKTYQKKFEVLEKMGKGDEAFDALKEGYLLNPENDSIAFMYASKLFERNKLNESVLILNEILERNTTYRPAKKLLEIISKHDK